MTVRLNKTVSVLVSLLLACSGVGLSAQNLDKRPEEFRGLDRWAFKTNALGWVATVPNFMFEVDMSKDIYSHWTFGMGVLYNWETYKSHPSYMDFNLLTVRPEFRYYWGAVEQNKSRDTEYKGTWFLGMYVSGGTYTMKLTDVGHQGYHTGIGISFGYAMPLYQYKTGAIDVEFGFYLGAEAVTSQAFVLNDVANAYDAVPELSRGFGPVPYPVVSDLSITFSWRRTSIKHKHVVKFENRRDQKRLAREIRKSE